MIGNKFKEDGKKESDEVISPEILNDKKIKTDQTMHTMHEILSSDRSLINSYQATIHEMDMMINELKKEGSKESIKIQIGNNTMSIPIDAPEYIIPYTSCPEVKEAMIKLMEERREHAQRNLSKAYDRYVKLSEYIKENNLEY